MVTCIFALGKIISNTKFEMADINPFGRYYETVIVNQVYDEEGTTGGYDLSEAWKYQDKTNLQYESQLIKMPVDDFYKACEDKGLTTGPIDYNDFELVSNKLRVKSRSIDLVSKTTGKPLCSMPPIHTPYLYLSRGISWLYIVPYYKYSATGIFGTGMAGLATA